MHIIKPLSENVWLFDIKEKTLPTLQISDLHIDSIHCKRDILRSHLDEIKKAGGLVFIYGDLLDVMASYGDRRLRREYVDPQFIKKGYSYLDMVIDYAVEFLKPYRENIGLISYGNHERTIQKFHDTDPLRRIVSRLNDHPKTNIALGSYSGWVFLRFNIRGSSYTQKIHYHHGFGGNAKRSKGMLDVQIEAMKYPDADILVRGHTHQKWYDPSTTRVRVTKKGRIFKDKVKYIQSGSYVDGIDKGKGGYAVERNFNPTDIGGWFVDFSQYRYERDGVEYNGIRSTVVETPVEDF